MIIAFTSDMIPRLVYYWSFSVYPYGNHSTHTMEGYINSSLSVFKTSDFSNKSSPLGNFSHITTCRYRDLCKGMSPPSQWNNRTWPLWQYLTLCGKSNLWTILSLLRYRDFRFPPGHPRQYEYNMYYWHVIAAKMAFIIVVEVGVPTKSF